MYIRICSILIASLFLMIGCQQKDNNQAIQPQNNKDPYTKINNQNTTNNVDNQQLATHLANVASDVPNVKDATAIVAGPYAVVGIDVDKHLDRSRVGTIKYSVSEALQHDPYGKTAVVIADGDITERIRLMGKKIKDGYPIQGIVDELSAIVGRYMPELPINEDRPTDPNQNKQILPKEDRDKLKDIEQNQSNDK